jgi:diacylglycerol kinase (ATP)
VTAAIVNPRAARRTLPEGVKLFLTTSPGHATALAREIQCDRLIVVGGDGTLNEVVNGLMQRPDPPPISLIPAGTASDFARTLRLLPHAGPTDVFRATFREATRYYVNAAGIGLAADVARRARALPTRARYLAAAIPVLAAGRNFPITIQLDDGPEQAFEITTAAIANGQYQGGAIRIAPEALPNDGLADLTVVQRVTLGEVAARLPILYNGKLHQHPAVRHFRATIVRITSDEAVPIELDGEPVGTLPLEISIHPRALSISIFDRNPNAFHPNP